MNRQLKNLRGSLLEFLYRAVIDGDGQMILFLSREHFQLSHASTGVAGAGASSSFTFFSSPPFLDQSGFFCKIEKMLRSNTWKSRYTCSRLDSHTGQQCRGERSQSRDDGIEKFRKGLFSRKGCMSKIYENLRFMQKLLRDYCHGLRRHTLSNREFLCQLLGSRISYNRKNSPDVFVNVIWHCALFGASTKPCRLLVKIKRNGETSSLYQPAK